MLAAMCLASCDDNDDPVPPGYGTLSVGLRTIPGAPLADLTLYVFNSDGVAVAIRSVPVSDGDGLASGIPAAHPLNPNASAANAPHSHLLRMTSPPFPRPDA